MHTDVHGGSCLPWAGLGRGFAPVTPPTVSIRLTWSLSQYLAYLETWSATRQTIQRIGRGFLDEAAVAVAHVWGPPETVHEVHMPVCVVAGRVEA